MGMLKRGAVTEHTDLLSGGPVVVFPDSAWRIPFCLSFSSFPSQIHILYLAFSYILSLAPTNKRPKPAFEMRR